MIVDSGPVHATMSQHSRKGIEKVYGVKNRNPGATYPHCIILKFATQSQIDAVCKKLSIDSKRNNPIKVDWQCPGPGYIEIWFASEKDYDLNATAYSVEPLTAHEANNLSDTILDITLLRRK